MLPLHPDAVPLVERAFGHSEELRGVAHIAVADELGSSFEEAFGGVRAVGHEADRRREAVAAGLALILIDADFEFDAIGPDGQIVDAVAGALLLDGFARSLAVRTESEFVERHEREAEPMGHGVFVDMGDAEVGEVEKSGPEGELCRGIHDRSLGGKNGRRGVEMIGRRRSIRCSSV